MAEEQKIWILFTIIKNFQYFYYLRIICYILNKYKKYANMKMGLLSLSKQFTDRLYENHTLLLNSKGGDLKRFLFYSDRLPKVILMTATPLY